MNKQVLVMKNDANKFLGFFVSYDADLTQYIDKAFKVIEGSVEAQRALEQVTEKYERGDDEHFVLMRPEHCEPVKQVLVLTDSSGCAHAYYCSEKRGDTFLLAGAKEYTDEDSILREQECLNRDPVVVRGEMHYAVANVADCSDLTSDFGDNGLHNYGRYHAAVSTPKKVKIRKSTWKTIDNAEKGSALLSIAILMLTKEISADEAASDANDKERTKIMMEQGIDGERAAVLLNIDIDVLTD